MNNPRALFNLLLANARHRAALQQRGAQARPRADGGDMGGDGAESEDDGAVPFEIVGDVCNVYCFDVIDAWWGFSADGLMRALKQAEGRPVHLYINSPGGDAIEARAICAALVAHAAPVHSHVVGYCCSAATQLALVGNTCDMIEGSLYMVHNAWTMGWGDKYELGKTVALLDKVDGTIARDYARRCNTTEAQARAWMDAETWFTPEEALAAGLIDSVLPNTRREPAAGTSGTSGTSNTAHPPRLAALLASAKQWDLSAYRNAPAPAQQGPTAQQQAQAAAQLAHQIEQQRQHNHNRLRLLQLTAA